MRTFWLWCTLSILLGLLMAMPARAQADFDYMVTFGDSLTHNDLLWLVYGNPPSLYEDDPNQCVFEKGKASGDELTSYAVGGSEAADVALQVDAYLFLEWLGLESRASIVGYEAGGNDILNNKGILKANAPGSNPSADAVIDNILANLYSSVKEIYNQLNCQIIIWTIPDVTYTPDLWGQLTQSEIDNLRAHEIRINKKIVRVKNNPLFVVADLYSEMPVMITNPPVIFGHQLNPPPRTGHHDDLFADYIHPTAVTNALIANEIIKMINLKWNDNIPLYDEYELASLAQIPSP